MRREKVVCAEDGVMSAMLIVGCVSECRKCSVLMMWVAEGRIISSSDGGYFSICVTVLCHSSIGLTNQYALSADIDTCFTSFY